MPERDRYIPGVPCWVDTSQPDPEAAVQFYSGLFGWEFDDVMPPGIDGSYFIGRIRGGDVAAVGSIPKDVEPVAVWNTYIWSDSVDADASRVTGAGGTVLVEPFDVMAAGRMAVCADPEGAGFNLWQAKQRRGAQIVNEPGSLNFNGLNTRNREGAKKFYGQVFGWQTLAIGGGFEAWTLPAYGDHLALDRPTIRQEMVDLGAPGFEDVVAILNAIGDDQPDTPAHWSVTFAVADADATAESAEKLGGKVAVPPFDAPWVRTTVIADPQGATLIASQFVPETSDAGERDHASADAG